MTQNTVTRAPPRAEEQAQPRSTPEEPRGVEQASSAFRGVDFAAELQVAHTAQIRALEEQVKALTEHLTDKKRQRDLISSDEESVMDFYIKLN